MSLTPFELHVRGRAMELDPNWCRTHYLLACIVYKINYFMWQMGGGKGKGPELPIKYVPWIQPEHVAQEAEAIERAQNSAAIDSMVDWSDGTAPAGGGG